MFMIVTTIFLITGTQFVSNSLKAGRAARKDGQLFNVALAGINHAISWLKRQPSQPVTVFDPKANTNDPDEEPETPPGEEPIGLVNEFLIDAQNNVWGRYEVARSLNAPARSPLPTTGPRDTTHYPGGIGWYAEDIGRQRGQAAGTVWRFRCRGYVFTKKDGYTVWTDPKARKTTLEAEVRRTTPNFRETALYSFWKNSATNAVKLEAKDPNTLKIDVADGTARPWWTWTDAVTETGTIDYSTPVPLTSLKNQASPGPTFVDTNLGGQLQHVFGTSDLEAVKSLADVVADVAAGKPVPQPMPTNKFLYIKGNTTFDGSGLTLDGSGILFVDGDLVIDSGTLEQKWNGLIFTTGTYTQKNKSTVVGAVMAGNKVTMKGEDGKEAVLRFSENELTLAFSSLAEYRLEHATIKVIDDGATPSPY